MIFTNLYFCHITQHVECVTKYKWAITRDRPYGQKSNAMDVFPNNYELCIMNYELLDARPYASTRF